MEQSNANIVNLSIEKAKRELRLRISLVGDRAATLNVASVEDEIRVAEYLKELKALEKEVYDLVNGEVDAAHKAWKASVAMRDDLLKPIVEAERTIKPKLAAWYEEQERRRREEEAKALAEARRLEEERRLQEAMAAEAEGNKSLADEILTEPIQVVTPFVPPPMKTDGVSMRENWKAEVVDLQALVRHVATHPELIGLLLPNQTALNQQARSLKGKLAIPGVKAICEKVVSSRAK